MRKKIWNATLWSLSSEIIAKIIGPLGFLILTKLLSPHDFGVIAVATTVISFINIVTDLGVGKVLIQENGTIEYTNSIYNIGFLINAIVGVLLTCLMIFFSMDLAVFFGNANSSAVIKIMGAQVLFNSLSTVQIAQRKKNLDFKFLFYLRVVTSAVPILISVPIAFFGGGYWSIVLGQVIGSFMCMLILWWTASWRPNMTCDMDLASKILNKSLWNTIDQVFVWLPIGLDTYLISKNMSSSVLGLYSTSKTLLSTVIALTIGAIMPILFTLYSENKDNNNYLRNLILSSQKIIFFISAFTGVGVYIFKDVVEDVLFNSSWTGVGEIFGLLFLLTGFEYFSSTLYEGLRAKGKFKITAISTTLLSVISIPILMYAVGYGIFIYTVIRVGLLYLTDPIIFYFSRKYLGITFKDCVQNSKNVIYSVFLLLSLDFITTQLILTDPWRNAVKTIMFLTVLAAFLYKERLLIRKYFDLIFRNNFTQ